MSMRRDTDASEQITGSGPLADPGAVTGGPIDDPTLADRNNPRWSEGGEATMPMPDAPPIGGPGAGGGMEGGPAPRSAGAVVEEAGTPQDQAAQPLDGLLESGTDNILEGRGDVQANPALAEGGDNG